MKACAWKTVFLTLGVAWATQAQAHAFLDHADPKVGSTVDTLPSEVRIWFTEEIEAAFSSVEVLDGDGKQVDNKDYHLDSKNKKLAIVSLPALPVGTYKVVWQVISTDTHKTQGNFTFTVKVTKAGAATHPSPSTATRPATATGPEPQVPSSNPSK